MNTQELKEELKSSFSTKKISLKWLFGEIIFERDDFLNLYEINDHISETLNKTFIERDLMHIDPRNESVDEVLKALKDNETFLDSKNEKLRGNLSISNNGLISILEEFRSACRIHARKIYKENKDIEEGNKIEMEREYQVKSETWLPGSVKEFRLSTYPLIKALIDFLPEKNTTKENALKLWYSGRSLLSEQDKDNANPSWKLITSDKEVFLRGVVPSKKWWQFWK